MNYFSEQLYFPNYYMSRFLMQLSSSFYFSLTFLCYCLPSSYRYIVADMSAHSTTAVCKCIQPLFCSNKQHGLSSWTALQLTTASPLAYSSELAINGNCQCIYCRVKYLYSLVSSIKRSRLLIRRGYRSLEQNVKSSSISTLMFAGLLWHVCCGTCAVWQP